MDNARISIIGSQESPDSEDESFELVTDGIYTRGKDFTEISYLESEMTGRAGTRTTFFVGDDNVVLTREDGSSGDMVFSESKKHHFIYNTPFGALTMGLETKSIVKNMDDDGGDLEIRYILDVDNLVASRNKFKINIMPAGKSAGNGGRGGIEKGESGQCQI
ncbi:MAG: DUF1934 domain-containing protein [Oscillospiraceae bacterium]|jgi:uncharacterized beta-barrel protein YwiB (DUF1934 family)|nr:DUF1934 domain-containing protein [Oscillospiraceae bacterium]